VDDEPLILASAKSHEVSDEDILNAYSFALGYYVDESGERPLVMFVGTGGSGVVLYEIGVVEREDYDATCIVHAMEARDATLRKAGLSR
jgi:hypothetical protein